MCCSSAWHGLRSATGQSAAGQTVCLCASLNVSCFSCLFPTFSLLKGFVLAHLLCILLFSHLHIMFFGGCCLFCLRRFRSLAIMWCAKCSDVWESFATHFLFQNIKVKIECLFKDVFCVVRSLFCGYILCTATHLFFPKCKSKDSWFKDYVVRSLCCGYILCTHFEVKSASSEWYCFALCVFTVALKSLEHHSTYCLSLTSFSVFTICVLCRLLLVCPCSCPEVTIMVDWV